MFAIFITHFWQYFFFPAHEVWYRGNVWGNVVAVLPLAILGIIGFTYHHFVLKNLHESHDQHLKLIIDALDPETDAETQIDRIAELVDETKPGGVTTVLEAVRNLHDAK